MIKIKIIDKKMVFENDASMIHYNKIIDAFSNTNKVLVMTVDEYIQNVSIEQHQLFKALLVKGSETSGYTYKEFEEELINNFAPYKYEMSIIGKMVKTRKQVSEMDRKEFSVFIEQSILFCNEFYNIKF